MSQSTFPLSIGPTHPAFKEPVKFSFEIEGEKVLNAKLEMGFTHRGIEHVARQRNFIQLIYLLERVCGICSFSHPVAYCMAVESAAGIEVPARARYIRTIIGELERLHSHLLWAGVAAHEIGFDTLFFHTWDIREKVLDCLEALTGNRVNYAMLTVGGVRRDIAADQYGLIEQTLDYYKELYARTREILLDDISIQMRCCGVGVLSYDDAIAYCAVGPTARASGVTKDVRVDYPNNAYPDIEWLRPITPRDWGKEASGDVFDRMIVRVLELKQSIDIIDFCLNNMPDGPVAVETKAIKLINQLKKVKADGIGRHEAPRGEVAHFDILDEKDGPAQVKVKAPTYSNAASWTLMFKDAEIADIPIIMASIDPCIACADRMSAINTKGEQFSFSTAELRRLSVAKQKRIIESCKNS